MARASQLHGELMARAGQLDQQPSGGQQSAQYIAHPLAQGVTGQERTVRFCHHQNTPGASGEQKIGGQYRVQMQNEHYQPEQPHQSHNQSHLPLHAYHGPQTPVYNPSFGQPGYGVPSQYPPSIISPPSPYPVGQLQPQVTFTGENQGNTHQSLQLQQQLELEEQQFAQQQLQQRHEFQSRTLRRRAQQHVAEGTQQVQTP